MEEKVQEATSVRDWYIIKIIDGHGMRIGQLLWGFVVDDTDRFKSGDWVCTSAIEAIDANVITTCKRSKYITVGNGKEFVALFSEVELLRRGYSPDQIVRLRI